jgi:leucyl aminopeptidase
VKRVRLAAFQESPPIHNLVVLTDKEGLDQLSATLTAPEFDFVQQGIDRDIQLYFFARSSGSVWVRFLKSDKSAHEAAENARLAGNEMLKDLRQYKIEDITLKNLCQQNLIMEVAEGMVLGSYQFQKYHTQPDKKEKALQLIRLVGVEANEITELNHLLEAVLHTRDLVNEPHSHFTALHLAEAALEAGKKHGFEVEVLGKEKIEALKMGGLLAINQASNVPPQFCILEYKPANAQNEQPIVLVGKGVVYDTGGLSLKPSEGMDYMKCDMAGAGTVIGVLSAAAANQLPIYLVGLIPATDNKIGEKAIGPGDVVRMYSGKTVEIMNTDAEGRIILADALHYAKKYKPQLTIDLATLTGAAVRALGSQAICYMGTASESIKQQLETSGWATYERLVELPLWKEYGDELKSNVADIKNVGSANAGMITAGKFLEHFVDYPWLHLDIAGPAYLRSPNGYRTKEGTGVGVRMLYHFLKTYIKGK